MTNINLSCQPKDIDVIFSSDLLSASRHSIELLLTVNALNVFE